MNNNTKASRREVLPAFIGVLAAASVLLVVMLLIQKNLLDGNSAINGFVEILTGSMAGNVGNRIEWILADMTEAAFLACPIATVFMIVGTLIAYSLEKKGSPLKGTGVSGLSPIFLPLFISSLLAIVLGTVCFGKFFSYGWIPTFASFLAVNAFICYYGTDFKKIITIIVFSVVATFFLNLLILTKVISPLGLPLFISVSITIFLIVPLGTFIFKYLPWMKNEPAPAPAAEETADASAEIPAAPAKINENKWFVNQIFGDIGSLLVWGSSVGTIFMFVGAIIAWLLNPLNPDYATGSFPILLFAQLAAAALAIFIYYPTWKRDGMALTFGAVVIVSAILTTYPNNPVIVGLTIVFAALIGHPACALAMKLLFKGQSHPIPYIQLGIFAVTIPWAFIVKLVLMPLLGL